MTRSQKTSAPTPDELLAAVRLQQSLAQRALQPHTRQREALNALLERRIPALVRARIRWAYDNITRAEGETNRAALELEQAIREAERHQQRSARRTLRKRVLYEGVSPSVLQRKPRR